MKRVAALIWLLFAVMPAWAQPDLSRRIGITVADTGVPGYRFEAFHLGSADGQRHYRVRVAVPLAEVPAEGFPAAFLLDGNAALMDVDAGLLGELAKAPRPPLLVFIGYDNDLRIDATARAYDYTPRRPGGDPAQQDAVGARRNGGAEAFLDLILDSIVPKVEAMAKVDPARRALWGHSYGGVFVLHALFTRPQAFRIYAAIDPSLWWGEGYLLEEEKHAQPGDAAPVLRLMTGDGGRSGGTPPSGRDPRAVEAMRRARASVPADAALQMADRLRRSGMQVEYRSLPGLSHGQTLGASLPLLLHELAGSP
ncbi:esterase [Pseudoxanthomonas kalamensis DSM 18571]|uniref:alpha/beta hydrolase n=1 Tax=Pseudoxanthomonas kalamensis TaxID=289483 RepID=UPI001390D438|nr:alpha/beta hydrolase-fold protein [Pseudoxanthomonas kalamensis]KAF1712368.1 esterase [Pseudoxanthomonas kalamensis DSM 18571]